MQAKVVKIRYGSTDRFFWKTAPAFFAPAHWASDAYLPARTMVSLEEGAAMDSHCCSLFQ